MAMPARTVSTECRLPRVACPLRRQFLKLRALCVCSLCPKPACLKWMLL